MSEICSQSVRQMSDFHSFDELSQSFEAMGPVVDYEVPLRYSDMDLFGHVNNARYFTFLEEARIAWFETCVPQKWDFRKHGVLVARNEMDYLKPVLPGDRLFIRLGASGLGNSSIHIKYEGYVLKGGNPDNAMVAMRAATTLVSWNTELGKVARVHEDWRKAIEGAS